MVFDSHGEMSVLRINGPWLVPRVEGLQLVLWVDC